MQKYRIAIMVILSFVAASHAAEPEIDLIKIEAAQKRLNERQAERAKAATQPRRAFNCRGCRATPRDNKTTTRPDRGIGKGDCRDPVGCEAK